MPGLLKNFYFNIENLKGKKLILTVAFLFLVFILIGILIGYFMTPRLNEDEISKMSGDSGLTTKEKTYYEGKIEYVNPQLYPLDEISYVLVDSSGKEMFLLKADDQKLSIAEGLYVKVVGQMGKLSDRKTDVLIVEEVIIQNVAD